jgi:hypothetical protein
LSFQVLGGTCDEWLSAAPLLYENAGKQVEKP